MSFSREELRSIRKQFPALDKQVNGAPAVYLDGPAGSQVPRLVIDAMVDYLSNCNANRGGLFETSRRSDEILGQAHRAMAAFVGADDPDCIVFGSNMTTLVMALARALSRTWSSGDEVVVTSLDHDANFTPWKLAACDAGIDVREVALNPDDCSLNLDDFCSKLSSRTRLVAFCAASNLSGSLAPVAEVCRLAREAGALSFVDAVHYAPHSSISVEEWGCDFLACSAYKFFGPHVGVLWGKRKILEEVTPYKLRPAPDGLPGRWMTGTQNHEGIAGAKAAVDYLASLREGGNSFRESLLLSFDSIRTHESELSKLFLDGFLQLNRFQLFGIDDCSRIAERAPTFSFRHESIPPRELVAKLAERGIFAWHGNFYAQPVTEALGLEPDGLVRVGFLHYTTSEEVERLLEELRRLS